jgi:protein arginine kinase activator
MMCDVCSKKKATVHLTEIVDEQMLEMHLCEECAREKSVQMEQQFGLSDLLAGLADFGKQVKDIEKVKLVCPRCGLSYEDFKKFGRLGCSQCYSAFQEQLTGLLKRIHGSNRHLGKTPGKMPPLEEKKAISLRDLRREMQEAIELEDFEKAAKLRDKIRTFEEQKKEEKNEA